MPDPGARALDLSTARDIVAKELGESAVQGGRLRGVEDVWQVQVLERDGALKVRPRRSMRSSARTRSIGKWLDRVALDGEPVTGGYRDGSVVPEPARAWVEETLAAWGEPAPELRVAHDRVAHVAWPTRDEEGLVGLRSGRMLSVRTDEHAQETRVLAVAGLVPGFAVGGLTWWGIGPVYGVVVGASFALVLGGRLLGRARGRALSG